MASARDRAKVTALVAVVTAVVVGIPVGVLASRDHSRQIGAGDHGRRTGSVLSHRSLSPGPGLGPTIAPVTGPPATSADSALVASTRDVPCPDHAGRPVPRQRLAHFSAVAVVTCGFDQRVMRDAVWKVAIRRVAASGVTRLVAALRLPSQPRHSNMTCLTYAAYLPPLVLVDRAGRYLVPRTPIDACDHPLPEAIRAVNALGWREVSVRPIEQVVSPEAYAAHCLMEVKDMPWIDAEFGAHPATGGPILDSTPRRAHVCVYRVTARDHEIGTFVRGLSLRSAAVRRLLPALARPGPTQPCPDVGEFAVISFPSDIQAFVELGGCWRVDRPLGGLGSADGAVVGAVIGHS